MAFSSPRCKERRPGLDSPAALLNEALLSTEDARHGRFGWSQWFAEFDVDASRMPPPIRFNSHALVLQAACDGQGVALGWSLLTDDMIRQGRLVRPMDAIVTRRRGFSSGARIVKAARRRSSSTGSWRN
jgi:DNA-binding transcriptional LysR family regulator